MKKFNSDLMKKNNRLMKVKIQKETTKLNTDKKRD